MSAIKALDFRPFGRLVVERRRDNINFFCILTCATAREISGPAECRISLFGRPILTVLTVLTTPNSELNQLNACLDPLIEPTENLYTLNVHSEPPSSRMLFL